MESRAGTLMEQAHDVAQRLLQRARRAIHTRLGRGQGKQAQVPVVSQSASCPTCKGAGFTRADVPVGHPDFGKACLCQCQQEARRRARQQVLRARSQIDQLRAFREASFATFNHLLPEMFSAYQAALRYAEQPDGWLVLVGGNGCGKTHLAVAIAKHCLVPDLLNQLRATFEAEAEEGVPRDAAADERGRAAHPRRSGKPGGDAVGQRETVSAAELSVQRGTFHGDHDQ